MAIYLGVNSQIKILCQNGYKKPKSAAGTERPKKRLDALSASAYIRGLAP